jgi:hypothetical protein
MMRRPSLMLLCLFSVTLCSLVFLSGCAKKPSFNTPYQLVLLDNGQAYFGKIESLNTFVLLTDIYSSRHRFHLTEKPWWGTSS